MQIACQFDLNLSFRVFEQIWWLDNLNFSNQKLAADIRVLAQKIVIQI